MFKKYRPGFDISGLLLFILVMIPNFIWFKFPAPDDVLRADSVTPIIDVIGSIFQAAFIAAMCLLKRTDAKKIGLTRLIIVSLAMVMAYFMGWILYYLGIVNPFVIILLTIPPCIAFVVYTIDRKNMIAAFLAGIFTLCHIIYGFLNFIFIH